MFRVMMTLDGGVVPSSAVKVGGRRECDTCAARLNRQKDKSPRAAWVVLPVVE